MDLQETVTRLQNKTIITKLRASKMPFFFNLLFIKKKL